MRVKARFSVTGDKECLMAHKYRNTNESVYVKVCLHHGVLLFLVSRGFLLIFVLFTAFDHYDEENNCNRTREKKKDVRRGQNGVSTVAASDCTVQCMLLHVSWFYR